MESANVVGYAGADTLVGQAANGTCFVPVTGATFNLQELTVTGYDRADGFAGDVNVQTLDVVGRMVDLYTWVDVPADPEDPESEAFYGWYDGNDEHVDNVTFAPGAGLWTHSDSTDYKIQSAGQVPTTDLSVTLRVGQTMVANSTPVAVDLQNVYVGGYDHADGFAGDVNVQTLDTVGRMVDLYTWVDVPADPEDPESEAFYGWYDGNDELVENVQVGAGEALWTHSDSTDYSLVFPGVTL